MNLRVTRRYLAGGVSVLWYQPAQPCRPVSVLITHGLTASAAGLDVLSAYLAQHGFVVAAVDLPGHQLGATLGCLTTPSQAVEAVKTALHAMPSPCVIGGHSFGAACSVLVSLEQAVAGTFVIAAPSYGRVRFTSPMGQAMREIRSGYLEGAPLDELTAALSDLLAAPLDRLLERPFLAVGARQDLLVPTEDLDQWKVRLPHCRLEWVDASHQDAPQAARVLISRWLESSFSG